MVVCLGQGLQGHILIGQEGGDLLQALPGLLQLVRGMGDGGLHLAAQGVVLQLHPADPLLHIAAQLLGLSVGLVQHILCPAVGLQFDSGGALFDGLIGGGVRLQSFGAGFKGVALLSEGSQSLLLGLLPGLAGVQGLLDLLQLFLQLISVPAEDGQLLLLLRDFGG